MRKPISAADRTPVRVVLVTMDSHLGGALTRAECALRRDLLNLEVTMHTADEWGGDPAALTRCHADIARADIVIATMLFLEDHIRAVLPALAARRDQCDAMICMLSAGEVVKLTRVGKFNMSAESTGAIAWLKRMRGRGGTGSNARGQMKMLRQLPRLLRFIPGTAQDVRAYFMALQYCLAGSEENLANMVRMLVGRYAAGTRAHLVGSLRVAPPVEYPEVGLYHPRAVGRIADRIEQLPSLGPNGRVGLLLLRSYALSSNAAHYDGVIKALEAKGLQVIPAFASGLDQREAVRQYFMHNGHATVDAVVSLTGFSLVGGPAYNDARAAEELLAGLDVPYVTAHPVEFQTLEQWEDDPRGLLPIEATMMVAIPELDGGIWPMTFGGRSSAEGGDRRRDMVAASGTDEHARGARGACGFAAAQGPGGTKNRPGSLQLSAEWGHRRFGCLSVGFRVAAPYAAWDGGGGIHCRCSRECRCAAGPFTWRQRLIVRRQRECCCPAAGE